MKALLSLYLILSTFISFGQLDFSLSPVPAVVDSTAEAENIIAHAIIKNHTKETIVIAWQRLVNDLPEDWVSYICSNITCAPPDVSMGTFSLTAGDSTNLDCYFQPEGVAGMATVELKLFLTDDTIQVINATYVASAISTANQEIYNDRLKVFPNPVRDQMIITSWEKVQSLEVFNMNGRQISVPFQSGMIDLRHISSGVYVLKLYGQDNKLLSINRILIQK